RPADERGKGVAAVRNAPVTAPGRRPTRARRRALLALLALAVAGLVVLAIDYWPETYLRGARAALKRRDYDPARAALLRSLGPRPGGAEAHLLLAQPARRANNSADAARHLDACYFLGGPPEAVELERGLGLIQTGVYNARLDALIAKHLARPDADE